MATKTIGPSGDYTTLAAYAAYLDTLNTLTAPEIGLVQNTALNVGSSTVAFTGFTPSATYPWILRPARGAGFKDHVNAETNALRYNTSNGAAIYGTVPYDFVINVSVPYATIQGLQFQNFHGGARGIVFSSGSDDLTLDGCIVHSNYEIVAQFYGLRPLIKNNVFILNRDTSGSFAVSVVYGGTTVNNTIVCPSNQPGAGLGLSVDYNTHVVSNNLVAGFATAIGFSGGGSRSGSGNAIDSGGSYPSGITGQTGLVVATEFENPSNASGALDLRLKSTSVKAKDNGTNTGTPATDIIGQSISVTNRDAGAWELQQGNFKTIGPSGDYTTLAAYAAYLDALNTLTTPETGLIQNTTLNVGGSNVYFGGFVPSSAYPWTLRPVKGAGFKDHATADTNALRYNASNGAAITGAVDYGTIVTIDAPYAVVTGLQFRNTSTTGSGGAVLSYANNTTIDGCIFECTNGYNASSACLRLTNYGVLLTNSLVVVDTNSATTALIVELGGTFINNTVVRPSNRTAGGQGFDNRYSATTITNCIVAGFTSNPMADNGSGSFTGTNNAIDHTSYLSGLTGQTSLVMATEFENPSSASSAADWRLKNTTVKAKDNGTNTDVPTTDIIGQAIFAGTNRDVGAWESQAGAPPVTLGDVALTTTTAPANLHAGEQVSAITGADVGATLSTSNGYFNVVGTNLVGTGWLSDGSYNVDIVQTLAGATNSPKTTTVTVVVTNPTVARLVATFQGTTTATLGTTVAGDLFIADAFRDGTATAPSLPVNWQSLSSTTTTSTAAILGKLIATTTSPTSGTWTNATSLTIQQWRAPVGYSIDVGAVANSIGTTNTLTYAALTLQDSDGSSVIYGAAGHRSVNQNLTTAPTGMTNNSTNLDATDHLVTHSTVTGVTTWTSKTVTLTGTASGWVSFVAEIKITGGITPFLINSASSVSAASNSLSFTPTIPGSSGGELYAYVTSGSNATLTTASTGWTKVAQTTSSTTCSQAIFKKTSTGSDALVVDSATTTQYSAQIHRMPLGTVVAYNQLAVSTAATNHNPPSLTLAGPRNALCFVVNSRAGATSNTVAPTNYQGLTTRAGTAGGGCTDIAFRPLAPVTTEDPGTFTGTSVIGIVSTMAYSLPPVITSSATASVAENAALALTLVGSSPLSWVIRTVAQDAASLDDTKFQYSSSAVIRSSVAFQVASTCTLVMTKPADLTIGDLMLAHVAWEKSVTGTPSLPSGWAIPTNGSLAFASNTASYVAWKIADAGDVAATNFTFDVGGGGTPYSSQGIIQRITGHDPVAPIDIVANQTTTSTTTGTFPSVTTTGAERLIEYFATQYVDPSVPSGSEFPNVVPTGTTAGTTVTDTYTYIGSSYAAQSAAGASGAKTVTIITANSGSLRFRAFTVAIKPASTTPVLRWNWNVTKDYEAPNDSNTNNQYVVVVRGTDQNSQTVDQTITVSVTDADDVTLSITSSNTASVAENATLSKALTANTAVTWAIRSVAQDATSVDDTRFEISGSTLRWASNGTKDYEAPNDNNTNNTYVVVVRATDSFSHTADQTITVTVTDVSETGALVLDSSGTKGLTSTAGLPVGTNFTACGWALRSASNISDEAIFSLGPGDQATLNYGRSGSFNILSSPNEANAASRPAQGDWFFWWVRCSGTGANLLQAGWASLGSSTFVTCSTTFANGTISYIRLGKDVGAFLDGKIAGFKLFDAVLTDAELVAESRQLTPVRSTNINRWTPLIDTTLSGCLEDYSPANLDWTAVGTPVVGGGPSIPLIAPTKWDSTRKHADIALSNSNFNAANAVGGADRAVLGTTAKGPGSWVFKAHINSNGGSAGISLGWAIDGIVDLSTYVGFNPGGFGYHNNGNGTLGNTGLVYVAGDDVYLAIKYLANGDFATWVKVNNSWWNNNASANPDTGVGGQVATPGAYYGDLKPITSLYFTSDNVTLDPLATGHGLTTFTAWDGGGADTTAPTITSSNSASVAENATLSKALTANESVTWSIRTVAQDAASTDDTRFELSGSTLRWASNGTKDYETPNDSNTNNTYVVVVRATDAASNYSEQTITVTVTDVDEVAPTITSSASVSVAENAVLAHSLTANESVTWAIRTVAQNALSTDDTRFELSGSTLRWLSNGTKDYETPNDSNTNNTYVVVIRATDTAGNTTDQTVTVTVTDVDEVAPTITSSASVSNAENSVLAHSLTANESVTWAIRTSGQNAASVDYTHFELSGSTLRWTSNGTKNYESPTDTGSNNTYVVVLRATDTAGNTTDQTITVTVTDVDDTAPTITSSATVSNVENTVLAHSLTANESVTWSIRTSGQDAASTDYAKVELSGSTLRWLSNGTKNYESPDDSNTNNTYVVVVRATDGASNFTDQTITITVTDADEIAPTITSSNTATVAENATLSKALTANETVTWAIRTVAQDAASTDDTRFQLSGSTLQWASNGTKDYETPNDSNTNNTYVVVVRATDTAGNFSDQTITVTVTDVDEIAPTITSSASVSVAENATLAHSLTANESVTWAIRTVAQNALSTDDTRFELSGTTLRWLSNGTKDYETPNDSNTNNTYVVVVRATDTAGNTTDQTITVTVTDVDEVAPTITSSASVSVAENAVLAHTLTANESVTWAIRTVAQNALSTDDTRFELSGSTLRWLSNGTKDYETPNDSNTNNTYVVVIRATDTAGNTTDQTVTVTVTDIDEIAPTITSSASVSVAENTVLAHTLTANESVTWAIRSAAQNALSTDDTRFELSGSTLRWLSNGTKDYETPNDSNTNNTYVVVIRATDTAGNTTDQTVTVTVTDADEIAPTITSSNTASVAENATLSKALTANETVTWAIRTSGQDAASLDYAQFELSGSNLRWASNGTKNYEAPNDSDTNNTYVVVVRATDTAGNTSDQTITVTVTDIDEIAPTITSSASVSVAENATLAHSLTANESVTWAIRSTVQDAVSTDAARFELSGTTLRWLSNGTKNFESPDDSNTNNTYVVVIRATDTAGNTTDQTITVTVTDIDEVAPTITSSATPSVAENATLAHALTANESVTWAIRTVAQNGASLDDTRFELSGSTLRWLANTTRDYESPVDSNADNVYVVVVRATDTAGNTTDQTISVTVTNVDDTAPTITSSATASVAENATLAHALTANESVTWSIRTVGQNAASLDDTRFELSGSTLRWASNGTKDYETPNDSNTNNQYVVVVRATDGASNFTEQTITITVTDVDDTAPTITSSATASVAENAVLAHSLTANETVTWTIRTAAQNGASLDDTKFELSGSTLRWASNGTKNYEVPDDSNTNNQYVVVVRATDSSSNFTEQTVTITVTDVDDTAPTITSSNTASVAENVALSKSLTANETVTWSIRTSGQDAASLDYTKFELSGSTLRWVSNGTQDYEAPSDSNTNNTYVVVVRATDTAGNFSDQTITVTVTNDTGDDAAPIITSSAGVSVAENSTLSHSLTANEAVTWTIRTAAQNAASLDDTLFELSGGTTLRFASNVTKDYETPNDSNSNNTYIVVVRATNGVSNFSEQTITVTVTDVVEARPFCWGAVIG